MGLRIVVVEDDRSLRRIYEHILDGDNQIELHSHADKLFKPELWEGVDATVVDMVLKVGQASGLDLLRWLHEFGLGGRRIITTGWTQLDREVLEMLADSVLLKPFDPDDLRRAVEGTS